MDFGSGTPGGDAAGTHDLTTALVSAAVWLLVGVVVGFGLRRLSVWLSRKEELAYGSKAWQVWGPPILCGLLFGAFGFRFGPHPLLLIKSLWVAVLVQVIFFDAEHKLILDRVILPAMIAAVALSFFTPHLGIWVSLLTGLAAGLLFLVLALIGAAALGADALGFGDVKLVAFLGLILGIYNVAILNALFLGVLFAGVISLVLVVTRRMTMRDAIPYGPFLAAGALVVLYQLGSK